MPPLPKPTALVLVHTDSIASYAWSVGRDRADELSDLWLREINDHLRENVGPVILVRQGWDDESRVQDFLARLPKDRRIVTMMFDESTSDWAPFLSDLSAKLLSLGVKSAIVGGIWYDPDEKTGCATRTAVYLRSKLPTKVDRDLVGCESDIEE